VKLNEVGTGSIMRAAFYSSFLFLIDKSCISSSEDDEDEDDDSLRFVDYFVLTFSTESNLICVLTCFVFALSTFSFTTLMISDPYLIIIVDILALQQSFSSFNVSGRSLPMANST
jgi:hypothetical protein